MGHLIEGIFVGVRANESTFSSLRTDCLQIWLVLNALQAVWIYFCMSCTTA